MITFNGIPWHVMRVGHNSPALIDREGRAALATTDPHKRVICVSKDVSGARLQHVLMHELTHAVMASYGMDVGAFAFDRIAAEEWACNLIADHASEIVAGARRVFQ